MILQLLERVRVAPSQVTRDPDSGAIVVEGVKYLGAQSANVNSDGTRNAYPLSTRQASQDLYEGARVYLNHPARISPGRERGYEEQIGRLRGPFSHRADGSYANLVLNPKHPLAESVAWDAANSPDSLGLSHNAQGQGRAEGQVCMIEQVSLVRSVDLVTQAATTRGLFESRQPSATAPRRPALARRPGASRRTIKTAEDLLEALGPTNPSRVSCDRFMQRLEPPTCDKEGAEALFKRL